MQFKVTAKRLKQALQLVEAVLPARTPLPAASYVKLSTKDGRLTLTTTNIHSLIQYTFAVEMISEGVAVVPAKKFLDFVKTLSTDEIAVELIPAAKQVNIKTGSIFLKLPILDDQEFPEASKESGLTFQLKQAELKEALRLTAFAAERDTDRYILQGCFLYFTPESRCHIIATDVKRLAKYSCEPAQVPSDLDKTRCVIPVQAAEVLVDHLTHDADVTITVGEKRVSIEFDTPAQDHYFYSFQQIAGNFPDCSKVIPNRALIDSVNWVNLLLALQRAISIVNAEGKVKLTFKGSALEIEASDSNSSADASASQLVEKLPIEYSGRPISASFTPKLLAQALEEMMEENLTFGLEGENKPWPSTAETTFTSTCRWQAETDLWQAKT
jgi:DNA polymerase III beta subunit